jgi:hypothetical protein
MAASSASCGVFPEPNSCNASYLLTFALQRLSSVWNRLFTGRPSSAMIFSNLSILGPLRVKPLLVQYTYRSINRVPVLALRNWVIGIQNSSSGLPLLPARILIAFSVEPSTVTSQPGMSQDLFYSASPMSCSDRITSRIV